MRWVKRHAISPTLSHQFSFCTMDPLVRKHPFLGSLRPDSLDVFETYTPTYSRLQGTRPASYAGDGSLPSSAPKQTADISDDHKRLMTVTAIWVSFCEEGWPGSLPNSGRVCKSKSGTLARRISDDLSFSTPITSLPTSPVRESLSRASIADCTPCSGFQGKRSASTGAAYMERRRAAARAASPSSSGIAQPKDDVREKHPHRSRMRALAQRLFHTGGKKSAGNTDRVPRPGT